MLPLPTAVFAGWLADSNFFGLGFRVSKLGEEAREGRWYHTAVRAEIKKKWE